MSDLLNYLFSNRGQLGGWTPAAAVLLNVLGIALGLLLTKLVKLMLAPSYDLKKIPAPPTADPILGHAKFLLRPDYNRVLLDWTHKYGSIFRFRLLHQWTVVVTDPAAAAQVLSTVPGRTHNYTLIDEVIGGPGKISMFGTQNEGHWRHVRKTTAPAFSMANVRRYYAGFLSSGGELLSSLETQQASPLGGVDLEPHLQRLMLRSTLEGLFEVPDATALPGFDSLVPSILRLMAESNEQITNPLRAAWYRTPLAPLLSRHFAACRAARQEVVAFHINTATRLLSRPEPSLDNTLLWACLHRLRHQASGRKLTPAELHPEVGMYTTAGFDSTASTVGWCMYAAALYPDQQQAVVAELRSTGVFGPGAVIEEGEEEDGTGTVTPAEGDKPSIAGPGASGEGSVADGAAAGTRGDVQGTGRRRWRLVPGRCPTPEDLARLPRMNAFINEVMRMYPATAVSAERCSPDRPVHVMGYTLPPGTTLWPMVYGIHMAAANWEQPEQFRPERWLEDSRCAFAREVGSAAAADATAATTSEVKSAQGAKEEVAAAGGDDGHVPRRFMPFGDGPKNCVGQNFGVTVVRAVVALLLSRYHVALHPDMTAWAPGAAANKGGAAAGAAGCGGSGEGGVAASGAAAAGADGGGGGGGDAVAQSVDTGALTLVAVITKLKRLRLVLTRRDYQGEGGRNEEGGTA